MDPLLDPINTKETSHRNVSCTYKMDKNAYTLGTKPTLLIRLGRESAFRFTIVLKIII
jgi:hypothetical protein